MKTCVVHFSEFLAHSLVDIGVDLKTMFRYKSSKSDEGLPAANVNPS